MTVAAHSTFRPPQGEPPYIGNMLLIIRASTRPLPEGVLCSGRAQMGGGGPPGQKPAAADAPPTAKQMNLSTLLERVAMGGCARMLIGPPSEWSPPELAAPALRSAIAQF